MAHYLLRIIQKLRTCQQLLQKGTRDHKDFRITTDTLYFRDRCSKKENQKKNLCWNVNSANKKNTNEKIGRKDGDDVAEQIC